MSPETPSRSRAILFFLFYTFALLALLWAGGSTPVFAATDACPTTMLFESSNDRDYVVVVGAAAPEMTRVEMTLYAKSASFELAKNDIAVQTPSQAGSVAFRSSPFIVSNPGGDRFLAAVVHFVPSGSVAKSCSPIRLILPTAESIRKGGFADSELGLRMAVAKQLTGEKTVIVPEASPSVPASCVIPFRAARIDRVFQPEYPPGARAADAKGIAKVLVSLDATGVVTATKLIASSANGSIDDATLNAARRTTYLPTLFLCKPEAGQYVFVADFTGAT